MEATVSLQLHLEDVEDQSRHNNLRLWGLLETTGAEDLAATAMAIFRIVAGVHLPMWVELDQIHRALGQWSNDPARPKDVICRLHHYAHKEAIFQKALEAGDMDFDGTSLKILPDLYSATLQRQALLCSLLDLARSLDFTYQWGFPLSVTFLKDQWSLYPSSTGISHSPLHLPGIRPDRDPPIHSPLSQDHPATRVPPRRAVAINPDCRKPSPFLSIIPGGYTRVIIGAESRKLYQYL